jgi:hypothetical protein
MMRKPKRTSTSPFPHSFKMGGPENLKREKSKPSQKFFSDNTIIYGENNSLPLRIAKLVDESPAATSCLETVSQFIKGSGFSNKDLEKIKINKTGQTLWDLHCALADSLALFWGFSACLKFNDNLKITNIYPMSFESVRLEMPDDNGYISKIKYNPYYGSDEYRQSDTDSYHIYDTRKLPEQILEKEFIGQAYYYGKTSPLYRFYPVPKYWSAKKWIEIDAKIQEFHAENLENGFFQSVLMNVIGDPSAWSKNPRLQKVETDANGNKTTKATKTVGEEFKEQMSESFSGTKKAGNVMVMWSNNQDSSAKISAFPSNTNSDLFSTLQDLTTKNITIATRVPGILANISEGVNLGSGGSEIQKAIEFMQSRTAEQRKILQDFYNKILPNLETPILEKIDIVNYTPVSEEVNIEDKFWEVMNEVEKREFIKKNIPNAIILDEPIIQEGITPEPQQVNENLKNMTGRQLQGVQRVVRKFNKDELNYDQAKQLLKDGYGFTDEQVDIWLIITEEE